MEGKLYRHVEVGNTPGDMILVEILEYILMTHFRQKR